MSEPKLKPCPFCGGDVYPVYVSKTKKFYMWHYASDETDCPIKQFSLGGDIKCLADAMEAWNRRASE